MRLWKPDLPSLLHITENMREWDKREIFALRWDDNPADFAQQTLAVSDFAWIAGTDKPIATVGAFPSHPGVWRVWMFATDDFQQIGKHLTRFVVRTIIRTLLDQGCHRAECLSMAGHEDAHRWLKMLGARHRGTLERYGKGGEDFLVFRWLREDAERVVRRTKES